jgi:hypothetical protein
MSKETLTASQIVIALADMASKGKYDNVTPQVAKQMDQLFQLVAELINQMEEQENNELEKAQQEAMADSSDKENDVE